MCHILITSLMISSSLQLLNDLNNEVEELRTFKINSRSSDGTLVGACMVGEPVDQYQVLQFEIDKLKQVHPF